MLMRSMPIGKHPANGIINRAGEYLSRKELQNSSFSTEKLLFF